MRPILLCFLFLSYFLQKRRLTYFQKLGRTSYSGWFLWEGRVPSAPIRRKVSVPVTIQPASIFLFLSTYNTRRDTKLQHLSLRKWLRDFVCIFVPFSTIPECKTQNSIVYAVFVIYFVSRTILAQTFSTEKTAKIRPTNYTETLRRSVHQKMSGCPLPRTCH